MKMVIKTDAAEPWERQPGESPKAFAAFSVYRDAGPERSVRAVSRELAKSIPLIKRWSSNWDWVERARAWDNDNVRKAKAASEKAVRDMGERHIKIASQVQAKALKALVAMPDDQIDARGVTALLKLGLDVERLNRGEPTELTENKTTVGGDIAFHGTVMDLGKLTDGELEVLDAIASKFADS